MKNFKKFALIGLLLMTLNAMAQTDKATTKKIIEAKQFVFVATAAIPMNSSAINEVLSKIPGSAGSTSLSLAGNNYSVKIMADSMEVYLPYFGRVYTPPVDRNENGYKFSSKKFEYKSSARKKGGWQVSVNPSDVKENQRLNFTISTDGYATLTITSNNRQSITYNGYLSEIKKP